MSDRLTREDVVGARDTIAQMESRFTEILAIARKYSFFSHTLGKYNVAFDAFDESSSGESMVVFCEYSGAPAKENYHYVPMRLFWQDDDSIDAHYANERKQLDASIAKRMRAEEQRERAMLAHLKAKYEGV